jgi:prephenate dehydrogenase
MLDRSKVIILGINGEMGRLLLDVFISLEFKVCGIDRNFNNIKHYDIQCIRIDLDSVADYSLMLPEVADADYIVLCLSEKLSIWVLTNLSSYIKHGAIIIDTLPVKQNYLTQVNNIFQQVKVTILSIHPLFKPALGFLDNNVILISDTLEDSETENRFLEKVTDLGGKIIPSTAVEHDRMMSIIQCLSHALILSFGLTLNKLHYISSGRVANFTTPFQKNLVGLLSRVINGNPHVYWDIQNKNRFNKQIYSQLRESLDYLTKIILDGDEQKFNQLFLDIRDNIKNIDIMS